MKEAEREKLMAELKENWEVKLPLSREKLEKARSLGNLAENADYDEARQEYVMLFHRITEIEDILARGSDGKECQKILEMMEFHSEDDELANCLKSVENFYKEKHEGDTYSVDEAVILYRLNKLRNEYLLRHMEKQGDIIFDLQNQILSLAKQEDNKEILNLCEGWDNLFDETIRDIDFELFQCDPNKITKIQYKKLVKPLIDLTYSTGVYFLNVKRDSPKTFSQNELYLVNHIFVSFLSYLPCEFEDYPLNAYYYLLDGLLEAIVNDQFDRHGCSFWVKHWGYEGKVSFNARLSTANKFKRDIRSLQKKLDADFFF